ncbi:MAG: DUF427 domain-containing protein [Ignavibacteriaceae bacterium]|nr:DUF427 domain-containing protein [Ignavibacteria bacterium]NNJ51742.1 DUF427 domain-containing protein [Ignavibacteriaceae bacterium]
MIKKVKPQKRQESAWDYPRPPRLEKVIKEIKIIFNNSKIALTKDAYRVLETSHPPVYYIPPNDIKMEFLVFGSGSSYCEWKGMASYYNVKVGAREALKAGWYYPKPTNEFFAIQNYVAFYADKMDGCFVDDELVTPQPGGFYGGWITKDIVGPFKGEPGSFGW